MKKKLLSVLLSTAMVAALLVGCTSEEPVEGGTTGEGETGATGETGEAGSEWVEEVYEYSGACSDDGEVINIYVWNTEFKERVTDCYPGYDKENDTIDGVPVNWVLTPNTDNAYQQNLDTALDNQADAAAADKIDIFLVEADYATKYIDDNASLALADLGITDADLDCQYSYTQDIVTDVHGQLKGSSWQGCPGVLIYNRNYAKEVLGTDDPATVQESVKDWATFVDTAAKMKEAGYYMVSSVNDTYRVYSNNVTSKWVENGKIQIDANMKAWVDDSKALVDGGYANTYELWGADWSQGFFDEGKVFCYFGPAWFVDFSMHAQGDKPTDESSETYAEDLAAWEADANSIATRGEWGACTGPQGFYWGGTWICAANGTDNSTIVKNIILTMTANDEIAKKIVTEKNDFCNNQAVMEAMAADPNYSSKVLGGQNPLGMYCEGVKTIDLSTMSKYDQACNEEFQKAMKNYFEGNATYEEALELFYKGVEEKHPGLSH